MAIEPDTTMVDISFMHVWYHEPGTAACAIISTMNKHNRQGTKLYCFSPPVMVATFVIEITLAVYTIVRYKMTLITRLAVATLFFLALFQMSEYFVCGGAGLSAEHWSRIGYASITMLPPLGLHLLHAIAERKRHWWMVWLAYALAAGFIVYFLCWNQAFRGYACTGNYVIFQLGERASLMYGAYYYSWLAAALALGMRWHAQSVGNKDMRKAIIALIVGYLVFLIPTAVVNSIDPNTRRGIPSIMCGFAVIFVIIIVVYILPHANRLHKR